MRYRLHEKQCVYCGDYANSEDHFPPRSFSSDGLILPSCLECNALASTDFPAEFGKRAELVRKKLLKKYARQINVKWTEKEIAELGPNLVSMVLAGTNLQNNLQKRIAWKAEDRLVRTLRTVYTQSELAIAGLAIVAGDLFVKSDKPWPSRTLSCDECKSPFIQMRKDQRFCSSRCRYKNAKNSSHA